MARVVVMGVTGCGKTTVGALLAEALVVPFFDGDEFHSEENVRKMFSGIPLTDEDRWPWLADVAGWLGARPAGVIACSALRRSYRDAIRVTVPEAVFVHLSVTEEAVVSRVEERRARDPEYTNIGADILPSQFASLEPLAVDEKGITVDVSRVSAERACATAQAWIEAEAGVS
jgi:gluconokinase